MATTRQPATRRYNVLTDTGTIVNPAPLTMRDAFALQARTPDSSVASVGAVAAAIAPTVEVVSPTRIAYDYETRDFTMYLDGELVGFARTHAEAETTLAELRGEILERAYGTEPEAAQARIDAAFAASPLAPQAEPTSEPPPCAHCHQPSTLELVGLALCGGCYMRHYAPRVTACICCRRREAVVMRHGDLVCRVCAGLYAPLLSGRDIAGMLARASGRYRLAQIFQLMSQDELREALVSLIDYRQAEERAQRMARAS